MPSTATATVLAPVLREPRRCLNCLALFDAAGRDRRHPARFCDRACKRQHTNRAYRMGAAALEIDYRLKLAELNSPPALAIAG